MVRATVRQGRRCGLRTADTPVIVLEHAVRGAILDAEATEGCRRLVHIQEDLTRAIALSGCRVLDGASAVTFENDHVRRAVRVS